MQVISGKKERVEDPEQHKPLEDGAFAVSFSNKKDADGVKERAEARKKKSTAAKKKAE